MQNPSLLVEALNPEQVTAVCLPAEHALILAGAGSGKTRVLTTRIAWLLQQEMISPAGILAVTFTNKAAKEMLTRLGGMLPINTRRMWVGTFHGLCNRFLRAHHALAGLPQGFQILDTQDQLSAIKRLLKQHGMDDDRHPPKLLQRFIAAAKEEGLRPISVPPRDPDTRKRIELYQLYENQCQREGVVDFAELILRSYELLRDNPALREHYQQRFRHILIDEFQDTNPLQYAWIKMFASAQNAIFAVGDDDQSIYAFRGARVGNMADFLREFSVKHQIKLEENYRSSSNILSCANALIAHNRNRLGKDLRTQSGQGEPVRLFESNSDFEEARWVVEESSLLQQEGISRRETAILYRSNAQSRVLETALFNAGVPYRVHGGLRFFERAEIKHALAYLRLLDNPQDDTSFLRIVNFPARGIGARSMEQLQDVARHSGCSLMQAIPLMTGKAGVSLQGFAVLVEAMREKALEQALPQLIASVIEASGLKDHYQGEKEGQDRIENLDELVNAAQAFITIEGFGRDTPVRPEAVLPAAQTSNEAVNTPQGLVDADTGETLSPLAAFLSHAALEAGDNQALEGQDAVQLMTVHAAKGLEFDIVFITGLEEGVFPHENAMSEREGLEEERRLMYVAITRARKRLYMSHCQTRMLHGQTHYHLPSRFLEELPAECCKAINKKMTPRFKEEDSFLPRASSAGAGASSWGQAGHSSAQGWVPGKRWFHSKFGEGTLLEVAGTGEDVKVRMQFPRYGVKWLDTRVAKLEPLDAA